MEILIFIIGFILGAISIWFLMGQMKLHFENTANKVLKESSQDLTVQNKEKLDEFFAKFKEKIEDFEKRTEENFKSETENFTKFDMNIKSFIEAGNKISQDTTSITSVMRADNRRQGSWGEIVLEKVLENSGLRQDEEYQLQKGQDNARPDAVILLPENRCVYIDAKTSISSWEAYVNAQEEEEKEMSLKSFKESTKTHISTLAKKAYEQKGEMTSPDYVLMFIPIESCYSTLFCDENALWEYAWKQKIMPVSPSTLLAALKIINSFHVVNRQNKNAQEIAKVCTRMLDKFAEMLKNITTARKSLDDAYIKLDGKGGILSSIDTLQELGATMNKQIAKVEKEESVIQ